ncbi:MAG: hypothetical protein H6Q70_654 [Firmicutes bacterium]|nr:hypothetical protein [Bacillota bacterium]
MQGVANKNTHNTMRPIFSANQTKTTKMHVRGTDDKDTATAAIFKHSKSSDYDESKLNTLQKSIMEIQDRILEIGNNKNINQPDKKEQIRTLNEMLNALKLQLNEQDTLKSETSNTLDITSPAQDIKAQTPTSAQTANKQNKTTATEETPQEDQVSTQDALNKTTSALLSTDAALKKEDKLHTTASEMNNLADVKKRELNFAIHHPAENPEESPLVLRDPKIIKKRQEEIHKLRDRAQKILLINN